MIAIVLFLNFGLMINGAGLSNPDMDYLRNNFGRAVTNKNLCKTMIQQLEASPINNEKLAYLGGLQAVWANHVFNPISKLNTFRKGRANIEKAVGSEKNNIEIRFVRYTIQKNSPAFLGYRGAMKTDEIFLKNNLNKAGPENLRQLIKKVLED